MSTKVKASKASAAGRLLRAARKPAVPRVRKATIKTPRVLTVLIEDCEISPLLAMVPMTGAVAERFAASERPEHVELGAEMLAERAAVWSLLDEQGIREPLKAHKQGGRWIIDDGRHRLEWAAARGKKNVPILEVTKAEGEALAFGTVIGRRHWSKGQRAWLGVMRFPAVCAATRQTRSDSVGSDGAEVSDSVGANTATALAAKIGVSADVVTQAVTLYRLFFAPGHEAGSVERIEADDLRAKYEMLIWSGAGLGGIIAGIAGGEATKQKPKAPTDWHHLDGPLAVLGRLSKAFEKWTPEQRGKAQALITSRVKTSLSAEFRLALGEALAAAE